MSNLLFDRSTTMITIFLISILKVSAVCAEYFLLNEDVIVEPFLNQKLNFSQITNLNFEFESKYESESLLVKTLVHKDKNLKKKFPELSRKESVLWHINQSSLAQQLPQHYTNGRTITFGQKFSAREIECCFFDRHSSVLLVVIPGFNNIYYDFLPFLGIFPDYDILFFNYHGSRLEAGLSSFSWQLKFDFTKFTFGEKEPSDLISVVNQFKKENEQKYSKVIGLGMCFGGITALLAQASDSSLFDYLVLDSVWPSFQKILNKVESDPLIKIYPQKEKGGFLSWIFSFKIIKKIFRKIVNFFWNDLSQKELPILNALKEIEIPTLFFFGNNDIFIDQEDIELMLSAVKHNKKALVITNAKHLLSFLKYQSTYSSLVRLFCDEF